MPGRDGRSGGGGLPINAGWQLSPKQSGRNQGQGAEAASHSVSDEMELDQQCNLFFPPY